MTFVKFVGSIPKHNQAIAYCSNHFGVQGKQWYCNHYGPYVYHFQFENETDALLFKLRWA